MGEALFVATKERVASPPRTLVTPLLTCWLAARSVGAVAAEKVAERLAMTAVEPAASDVFGSTQVSLCAVTAIPTATRLGHAVPKLVLLSCPMTCFCAVSILMYRFQFTPSELL